MPPLFLLLILDLFVFVIQYEKLWIDSGIDTYSKYRANIIPNSDKIFVTGTNGDGFQFKLPFSGSTSAITWVEYIDVQRMNEYQKALSISPDGKQACWFTTSGSYYNYELDTRYVLRRDLSTYPKPTAGETYCDNNSYNTYFLKFTIKEEPNKFGVIAITNRGEKYTELKFYNGATSVKKDNKLIVFGHPNNNYNLYMYFFESGIAKANNIIYDNHIFQIPLAEFVTSSNIILCDKKDKNLLCIGIAVENNYGRRIASKEFFLSCDNDPIFFITKINEGNAAIACNVNLSGYYGFNLVVIHKDLMQSGTMFNLVGEWASYYYIRSFEQFLNRPQYLGVFLYDSRSTIFLKDYYYMFLLSHYNYQDSKKSIAINTSYSLTTLFTDLSVELPIKIEKVGQGQITPADGSSFNLGTQYKLNNLKYKSIFTSGIDEFRFSLFQGDIYSGIYTITLTTCHNRCSNCDYPGNDNKNNCTSCISGYYWIIDYETNCIPPSEKPQNYYLNGNRYEPCYKRCQECNSLGDDAINQCTMCIPDLTHWIYGKSTNCIYEKDKPTNYYLNTYNDQYEPCYDTCGECIKLGNDARHECTVCKENYYFIETEETNCIPYDNKPYNFYLDTSTNTFRQCYHSCYTCTNGFFMNKHNCDQCANGYFFIDKFPTNCVLPSEVPENFYFDINKNMYRSCYETCGRCTKGGSKAIHNCDQCLDNFYPLEDLLTNCYNEPSKPDNYYLDESAKMYRKCYQTCDTCYGHGTSSEHNCTTCIINYYKVDTSGDNCIKESEIYQNFFLDVDNIYKSCYSTCKYCSEKGTADDNKCDECITVAYKLENKESQCVLKCPQFYYTNNETRTCGQCYSTCQSCYGKGNAKSHKCNECKEGLMHHPYYQDNCVDYIDLSQRRWYLDDEYNLYTTQNLSCIDTRPILVGESGQCVESCSKYSTCLLCKERTMFEYNKMCVEKCPDDSIEDYNNNKCNMIYAIGDEFFLPNNSYTVINKNETGDKESNDSSSSNIVTYEINTQLESFVDNIDSAIGLSLASNGSTVISSTGYKFFFYERNNSTDLTGQIPQIYLGSCEDILREAYGIQEPNEICVASLFVNSNDDITGNLKYKVYDKYGNELDLSYCNGTKIIKEKPINEELNRVNFELAKELSDEGYDIFDPESDFYNDPCTVYSDDGKDVPLSDRQTAVYTNASFCEEGCDYQGINYTTMYVTCECTAGGDDADLTAELIDNSIIGDFKEALSALNLELFKCVNLIQGSNLKGNIGHWIMISILTIEVVFGLMFAFFQMANIYSFIYNKIYQNKELREKNNEVPSAPPRRSIEERDYNDVYKMSEDDNYDNEIIPYQRTTKKYIDEKDDIIKKEPQDEDNNELDIPPEPEELNEMEFDEAKKEDQRSFCQIFIDMLKEKQIIIQTIFSKNNFYPMYLRIVMLAFTLSIYLFLNALLYDDSYISDRYNSEKELNFSYVLTEEIERSLYASVISLVISRILQFLTSSNRSFKKIIAEKYNTDEFEPECHKLISKMKSKQIITFIILIIMNGLSWYYITVFCIVNKNNQIAWLQSSGITTAINMMIPFVVSIIITIFRHSALKNDNEMFYKISSTIYEML